MTTKYAHTLTHARPTHTHTHTPIQCIHRVTYVVSRKLNCVHDDGDNNDSGTKSTHTHAHTCCRCLRCYDADYPIRIKQEGLHSSPMRARACWRVGVCVCVCVRIQIDDDGASAKRLCRFTNVLHVLIKAAERVCSAMYARWCHRGVGRSRVKIGAEIKRRFTHTTELKCVRLVDGNLCVIYEEPRKHTHAHQHTLV